MEKTLKKLSKNAKKQFIAGLRQSKKIVNQDKAELAYIARDAEGHVVFSFENLCKKKNVKIIYINSMKELAKICSVEVPTAIAVVPIHK